MKASGNIRKMKSELRDVVHYTLPLYDILNPAEEVYMNGLVGKRVKLTFDHAIHCVVTGKKIKKAYGEGMSYDAFRKSPLAVESIIRPELSRIHEGIALRDKEWEEKHHLQPHYTYLSLTSGVKVGVTRKTQIPTRWIDQGAVQGLVLAETPYRQAAGLIEVALKKHLADKTNWRAMLKNDIPDDVNLIDRKNKALEFIPEDLMEFVNEDAEPMNINYPVTHTPEKVKSMKFDKIPVIDKTLTGIKGQYLIFDDDSVINLRSQTGYRVTIEA